MEQLNDNSTLINGFTYHTSKFWHSQETDKIDTALCAFHGVLSPIERTGIVASSEKNGGVRFHLTLSHVLNTIRPLLKEQGLFVMQIPTGADLLTKVTHVSGQFYAFSVTMPALTGHLNAAQNYGSVLTYYKRYCLVTVLAIDADEDTDAETLKDMKATEAEKKTGKKAKTVTEQVSEAVEKTVSAGPIVLNIDQAERQRVVYHETIPSKNNPDTVKVLVCWKGEQKYYISCKTEETQTFIDRLNYAAVHGDN
jgi:hypothetical protein